jgi:hypothetical protein
LQIESDGSQYLALDFRLNRHAVDVEVIAEQSHTLAQDSWQPVVGIELQALPPDPETYDPRYRLLLPVSEAERIFTRLRGTLTP